MTITSKSTDSVSKARASRNEAAKKEILKRIHNAHRLAHTPEGPYPVVRNYHREYDFSDDELREILIDRLLDYKAIVKESSEAKLSDTIVGLLE